MPRAEERAMLEELEKFTFCDVCILLIKREIEMYEVNEQMSRINLGDDAARLGTMTLTSY